MAIERVLGTETDPDIVDLDTSVEVIPEPSRQDQIREAANILVQDEQVFTEEELMQEPEQDENCL